MATTRKKKTTKKAAAPRKARKRAVGKTWGLTAAQKAAAKRVKPRAEAYLGRREAPKKKTRKRKSRAVPIAAHPPSPRGGRPCKACAKIHSKRQHGSHAEGPRIAHSYKTRAEGIRAKPKMKRKAAKKRTARKARAK